MRISEVKTDKDGRKYIIAPSIKSYPKDSWVFDNETQDLFMQRVRKQQAEKEIEEKAANFIEEILEDLFSDKSRNTSKKMEFTINI